MKTKSLLNNLIDQNQFEHYFQPIYNLNDNSSIGGEFLLRTNMGSPDFIFSEAKKTNRLYDLDTKSIHKALTSSHFINSRFMKKELKLFINVFPSTLINKTFPTFLNDIFTKFKESCQHIIFEINETDTFDLNLLFERVKLLKEYGFSIALDDVGKGWPSMQSIIEFEPNYIKLDRYFSKNLEKSVNKQDMIKSVLSYCDNTNVNLVLEGIENEESLHTARDIGVRMAQGYYLGMPEKIN
ncbi:EAL domain-containing protein [Schinkia azotoformans]|uniref:EAL domain-containing protein n=1 Tax=Schinkia azotoformans TaxID=1454 RepID=UPI002DB84222|nr:EAL domain-containing protein [Schinkia azotoformans]MEC1771977.1 EAL domain-containing protein [Schinkia azotoformans]MED4366475.1 EAL domain-containing protein [Schinkia azotoformans]